MKSRKSSKGATDKIPQKKTRVIGGHAMVVRDHHKQAKQAAKSPKFAKLYNRQITAKEFG